MKWGYRIQCTEYITATLIDCNRAVAVRFEVVQLPVHVQAHPGRGGLLACPPQNELRCSEIAPATLSGKTILLSSQTTDIRMREYLSGNPFLPIADVHEFSTHCTVWYLQMH